MTRRGLGLAAAAALLATMAALGATRAEATTVGSWSPKTHPIYLPTVGNQWGGNHAALQPPAPPCPTRDTLPCQLPELPAFGAPYVGNMAYWGGHVQVTPKQYLIFLGWGRPGAFDRACAPVSFPEVVGTTTQTVTLGCDPDGAGKRMADFVSQMGGTPWAGVTTQYYQTVVDASGNATNQYITNPANVLAGVWVDDTSPTGAGLTYTQMAEEAQRAMNHFGVSDLLNANFIIAQPENFSDPQAASQGYCAFHDYTQPGIEGGIYNNVLAGLAYTNMPYVLSQGFSCGENSVNAGSAGALDGVTIVLGHEILEVVTDPGAEDVSPDGQLLGAWFDPFDANENADKCAWVGSDPLFGLPGAPPQIAGVPGEMANITGNRGTSFAVQSTWSNNAAGGLGYCAGAGNDLSF